MQDIRNQYQARDCRPSHTQPRIQWDASMRREWRCVCGAAINEAIDSPVAVLLSHRCEIVDRVPFAQAQTQRGSAAQQRGREGGREGGSRACARLSLLARLGLIVASALSVS